MVSYLQNIHANRINQDYNHYKMAKYGKNKLSYHIKATNIKYCDNTPSVRLKTKHIINTK